MILRPKFCNKIKFGIIKMKSWKPNLKRINNKNKSWLKVSNMKGMDLQII